MFTSGASIYLEVEGTISVSVSVGISGDGIGMQQYGEERNKPLVNKITSYI